MAEGKKNVVRCKACGKPINGKHECKAVRIEVGEVSDGAEFSKKKPWGYMHHRCFLLAIGAPII